MVRLSLNEVTTYRWTFEEDVANCVAADIPGIGVWRPKLADIGEEKGAELLAESGLTVSNLLWAGGFTGSDGRSFAESVADGLEAVRLAAAIKAKCLVVYSGSRFGHTYNHARRMFKEAMHRLLNLAGELQVDLAIEPMHAGCAEEWTFFTCLDDALALIDELDHPYLRLVFDTYHLGFDDRMIEWIPELVPYIAVVHLGDGKGPPEREQNRCPLGEGVLPLREILAALREADYDGYCDIELIGEEIEASDYRELVCQSRRAFECLMRS